MRGKSASKDNTPSTFAKARQQGQLQFATSAPLAERSAASGSEHRTAQRCGSPLYLSYGHCCDEQHVSEGEPDGFVGTFLHLKPCMCRKWYCEDCATKMGKRFRPKLRERLAKFTNVYGITLTIDGSLFATPEEGWRYVMDNRLLAAFVKKLHQKGFLKSRDYFWVVEWQKDTEQAHWHLMVDAEFVPYGEIVALWSSFRPKWAPKIPKVTAENYKELERPAFGSVRFTLCRERPWAAAAYATKYLVKVPQQGFPDWVLDYEGRIPRYNHSKGFFSDGTTPRPPVGPRPNPLDFDPESLDRRPERKSLRERVGECRGKTVILSVQVYRECGLPMPQHPKFVGTLNVPFSIVCSELDLHPMETDRVEVSQADIDRLRIWEPQSIRIDRFVKEDDW